MLEQIKETATFIQSKISFKPDIGIILGTGLGGLVEQINIKHTLSYEDIPNFRLSTVEGHSGKLIFGELSGKKVVVMQGRFHFYEGYTLQEVTFPVRVMKFLGIQQLFVSNASGGMNPNFEVGDLMIINDHINFIGTNPLIGPNIRELGPRFPDMSDVYDKELILRVKDIAAKNSIDLQEGVYLGLSGPTFETPAEYKMLRIWGADTVGMSTVPEIIVARHMGITCFAISIITDLGIPGKIEKITHEEVQRVAAISEKKMTFLFKELIKTL
ncbi:MAG TPA: purine-nucleoside phosphorylase [Bacteroidia bacterium]|nr:purine-nucleoside phosphorylase [Bacteroidia bacterium]